MLRAAFRHGHAVVNASLAGKAAVILPPYTTAMTAIVAPLHCHDAPWVHSIAITQSVLRTAQHTDFRMHSTTGRVNGSMTSACHFVMTQSTAQHSMCHVQRYSSGTESSSSGQQPPQQPPSGSRQPSQPPSGPPQQPLWPPQQEPPVYTQILARQAAQRRKKDEEAAASGGSAAETTVPREAWLLGFAGLIPFFALSPVIANAIPLMPDDIIQNAASLQVAYGIAIASFLGGVHWGVALTDTSVKGAQRSVVLERMLWGVTPSLLAFPTAAMAAPQSCLVLSLCLGAAYIVDRQFAARSLLPQWYMPLRGYLTTGAITALLVTFGTAYA